MPAFYRIINTVETKASTGRVFVYLVASPDGNIYGIGASPNLNVQVSRHPAVEHYAAKFKKPAHIWVVGSIIKENVKQGIADLEKKLMAINCTTLKNIHSEKKQPSWKHVETVLEDWRRVYRAKYSIRKENYKGLTSSSILDVFHMHSVDSPRIRKLLAYIASSYYENYHTFIFPMPTFYKGDTDSYRKDLHKIKHLVYTKQSPNAYASINFMMTKALEEEVIRITQEKEIHG